MSATELPLYSKAPTTPPRRALPSYLPWAGCAVCATLLALSLLFNARTPPATLDTSTTKPEAAKAASGSPALTTVTLPDGKFHAAHLRTDRAEVLDVPSEVGVPGKIEANTDHRIEVRPRASGVIREVRVTLGQKIKKGDLLAVLDSADIGTARLNLRTQQRMLATTRIEAEWKDEVAANVAKLIPELRKGVSARAIEKAYADRPLGQNRSMLLLAYSEFEIASHEAEKTADLHHKNIIGEHPAFVAMHTREGAQAKFEAALEQVRFDANQQKLLANQQVRNAEAAVIDAAQRLRILGVSENIEELLANARNTTVGAIDEEVTSYPIVAPFDGTIITRSAVPSQKAEVNDVLFTLADLSTVWVMANIPESDFAVLPRLNSEHGSIRLTATAYPNRTFDAKLLSIGALVDPTTRTVPLLAETPNPDDMLKLGMFVRIVLDSAVKENALTVPAASVIEIEGQKAVFVPAGKDGRTFTLKPVKVGREVGDRQVIRGGLARGDAIVSSGAFYLKSELILQNEPEED